ncbi:hypothetical protein [Xanthomonas sacchari]|uniref:hypothetical protein n=1 Tax=Xanthomonas sacchari TaxID=56458 RepID=UPI0012DFF3E0|nr:hypothetical protein [Xanthomonas sacchari]
MAITNVRIACVLNQATEIVAKGDTKFRFKLTPQPDSTWKNVFYKEYSAVKDNMQRSMDLIGDELVLSCHYSQLESKYLPRLKQAVVDANEESARISKAFEADMAKRREKEAEVELNQEEFLRRINEQLK